MQSVKQQWIVKTVQTQLHSGVIIKGAHLNEKIDEGITFSQSLVQEVVPLLPPEDEEEEIIYITELF